MKTIHMVVLIHMRSLTSDLVSVTELFCLSPFPQHLIICPIIISNAKNFNLFFVNTEKIHKMALHSRQNVSTATPTVYSFNSTSCTVHLFSLSPYIGKKKKIDELEYR